MATELRTPPTPTLEYLSPWNQEENTWVLAVIQVAMLVGFGGDNICFVNYEELK